MKAYVLVKTHVGETEGVISALRRLKGVRSAEMTFGPYDAVVLAEASDLPTLGHLVAHEIRCTSGVTDTLTLLVVGE